MPRRSARPSPFPTSSVFAVVAALHLGAVGLGCAEGSAAALPPESPTATSGLSPPAAPPPPVPEKITKLSRARVLEMVKGGVGRFLHDGQIEFADQPVMKSGKFHGRRLVAFRPDWDIGLSPGDVILRVNGSDLAMEDDAFEAMQAAAKAKSIRIEFERA